MQTEKYMETKFFDQVARFSPEKHVHVTLFSTERTKVLLLCLSPGLTVPPHSHPGFEITLQPLKGKGLLHLADGTDMPLVPGEIHFVDGSMSFNPANPYEEEFEMLIHLVKR